MQKSSAKIGVEGMIDQCVELLTLRFQFRQIRFIFSLQFFIQAVLGLNELGNQRLLLPIEHQPTILKCTGGERLCELGSLLTAEHGSGGSDQLDHGLERDPQAIFCIGHFRELAVSEQHLFAVQFVSQAHDRFNSFG